MNANEMLLDRLQRLPDNVTLEEIREELETMIAIQEGLDDHRAGRVCTHQQVIEMSKSWITESSVRPAR
jgi:predicted transcriptional regulator